MNTGADISTLYREFTDALTEVLAESAGGLARRGRLARARAVVKKHPDYTESGHFVAVKTHSKIGKPYKTLLAKPGTDAFDTPTFTVALRAAFGATSSRPSSLLSFCCQRSSEVHDWPNELPYHSFQ
jgi:hypothetical protein